MSLEDLKRSALWNSLTNMGDYIKLNLTINQSDVLEQLTQFEPYWIPYNQKKDVLNNRWGLPITSIDGKVTSNDHLNSFGYMKRYHDVSLTEDNFNTLTEVYYAIPELAKLVDLFSPDIGRVHLLRVDQGGYFPPHRDFPGPSPEYFRLITVFGNCSDFNYVHLLDDHIFRPDPSNLYFVNFQLNHSVFSFSNNLYCLILTVKLTQRTHDLIVTHSMAQ